MQAFLTNAIDWEATRDRKVAAILGESPSKYAKSPTVWNAGFEALGIPAIFLPFDVPEERLEGLVSAMRKENRLLGFSVTVPYKLKIIPLLDRLDPKAKATGFTPACRRAGWDARRKSKSDPCRADPMWFTT